MSTSNNLEQRVDHIETRLDSLKEHMPDSYRLEIVQELQPLRHDFAIMKGRIHGVVALAVILLSVGGFWIESTFSKMSDKVNEAQASLAAISEDTTKMFSKIANLKEELDKIDVDFSNRVQKVEKSVENITSQPLPPKKSFSDGKPVGTIVYPVPDTMVGAQFEARGTVSLEPNQIAWLAVRIGRLYWPKEPAITNSGPWTRTVYEGGVAGKKVLALLVVDNATDKEIREWFDAAQKTGSYPGILLNNKATTVEEIPFLLR